MAYLQIRVNVGRSTSFHCTNSNLLNGAQWQGRRNRGSRDSGCSPTFGAGHQCSPGVCRCDRPTAMIIYRWKSLVIGLNASFIIASWSRRFVIQIYLSIPRITFISIDLQPNDLKRMDLFLARRCICPPRTHCTQGLQNITQKWPTSVFLAGVLRQNYCRVTYLLLHMDVHSCC